MERLTLGVHHVGLTVRDVAQARDFFVEILGFQVVGERPHYPAIFVSDGATLLTLWQATAPVEDIVPFDRRAGLGLHHLALRVARREDLEALQERVGVCADPDVAIEFPIEPLGSGGAQHLMFSGPSGLRLELIWVPA